jgi:hypothetical protein
LDRRQSVIDRLKRDHLHIAGLAAQVEACLAEEEPPLARLGNARWVLARALFAHIAAEDGIVAPRLDEVDPEWRHRARREGKPLRQRLHEHIARWGTPQIVADWQGYRADEARLLAALRARFAFEESELFPRLAERPPVTLQ